MVRRLLPLLACLPLVARAQDAAVGEVNTLWVIPQLRYAWVEPLYAKTRPGGRLYTVGGYIAQRDLGQSMQAAVDWLAGHPAEAPGFAEQWRAHDLYFSWPDVDQPRGGPSAGVAIAVVAYSAMLHVPVRRDVVFTGGIDRDGRVLGVGGLELKVPAALNAGMKVLCLPAEGSLRPETLDYLTARRIRIVALHRAEEALFEALGTAGPEAKRYDRMRTLWRDALTAITHGRDVAARAALDELVEICPNDLSAMRLQANYRQVDMRVAAKNLFADAAQYERDGLPDEALKAARRAWSYADEETRARNRELLTRLERTNLAPEPRAKLDRAQELVRGGDVGGAWRLLAELLADEPQQAYLQQFRATWQAYGAVAKLEDTLRVRDDSPTRAALAEAYLAAQVPARALAVYQDLRRREPEQPRWLAGLARAQSAAGRETAAAATLREARALWPDVVAQLCQQLGLELDPPSLTVTPPRLDGGRAFVGVTTVDAAGPPTLVARLGDTVLATAPAPVAQLELDLGRLPTGPQTLHVVSRDRFGNEAEATVPLTVPARPDGPLLRADAAPAGEPGTVDAAPGERLTVPLGATVVVDGGAWFAGLDDLASVTAAGETAQTPPYRLAWRAAEAGEHRLEVSAARRGGAAVPPLAVTVTAVAAPPAILSPVSDTVLTSTVPVAVSAPGVPEATVTVLLDGRPAVTQPGTQPWSLDPHRLAPGQHALSARLARPDGSVLVASAVGFSLPAVAVSRAADEAPAPLPATAALLTASAALPDPALRIEPPHGAARFVPAAPTLTYGPEPRAEDVALRLDAAPWPAPRRLVAGHGEPLAFGSLADPAVLGPQPELTLGPLATGVWRPREPGTYRLPLADGPAWLTVTETPPLRLSAPATGARLTEPTPLAAQVADPGDLETLTLVDGDRALGTWRPPLPDLVLDPAKLPPGLHPLRLVATRRDGTRWVSAAVVVETG